jgi:hypothetical protein
VRNSSPISRRDTFPNQPLVAFTGNQHTPEVAWKLLEQGSIIAYAGPSIEFLAYFSGSKAGKSYFESITVRYVVH